jgi:hypothetical protein
MPVFKSVSGTNILHVPYKAAAGADGGRRGEVMTFDTVSATAADPGRQAACARNRRLARARLPDVPAPRTLISIGDEQRLDR